MDLREFSKMKKSEFSG